MKTITTHNPYNQKPLKTYELFSDTSLKKVLEDGENVFQTWKLESVKKRAKLLGNVADTIHEHKDTYSKLMTSEMGKPVAQSRAELEKCIFLCDFYRKNADLLLSDEIIASDAHESFISYDPLGVILAIMPWNYPFWQVLRFAIPTLTAGNTAILKHASNVTGCALILQDIFEKSGYPKGCFQTILADHDQLETLMAHPAIKAVSLTGSEKAGKSIAGIAGRNLKKTVLELGGNNACIVLKDANLDKYLDTMVQARMQNTGQSCIAAKRFIVEEAIYDEFLDRFTQKTRELKVGDPCNEATQIGVLARVDLAETLADQVERSIKLGAMVHWGNKHHDAFYEPTILKNVTPGMPAFDEETFGPVAAVVKVATPDEAFEMANKSRFGLGTMVFTENIEAATHKIPDIADGAFFINEMVKSDPRLPFGGTKVSGYGRELSREGILEFVNKKTVYINK